MRRLLPVVIALIVLAAIGDGFWIADRGAPIPSSAPKTVPAVGSCWNVPLGVTSWASGRVACTSAHTLEVFFTGQADHSLIKDYRSAKGENEQAVSVLMGAEARSGCSGHSTAYLGGAWRGAQLTIVPDFVAPEQDGFYACAVAQVSDPGGSRVVTRTSSLRGGVGAVSIDCYTGTTALSFVPCTAAHLGEYVGLYTVTPLGATFNGPELQTAVTGGCQKLLNAFLALPPDDPGRTDLRSSYVGPTTSATWLGSDQSFACYATASATMHATVKGLGTRPLPH